MISKDPFIKVTDALKESGNYRVFNDVLREAGNFPRTIWYSKYGIKNVINWCSNCLLYTSPSPRDQVVSRMPSSA